MSALPSLFSFCVRFAVLHHDSHDAGMTPFTGPARRKFFEFCAAGVAGNKTEHQTPSIHSGRFAEEKERFTGYTDAAPPLSFLPPSFHASRLSRLCRPPTSCE